MESEDGIETENFPDKFITGTSLYRFLLETGLLFEINRSVLHPLGLALGVRLENDETAFFLWDCRDDSEGILFTEKVFNEGFVKLEKYMNDFGNAALSLRKEKIGFVVQSNNINKK